LFNPQLLAPSLERGLKNPRGDPMRKYETFFIVDPDLPDEMNSVVDTKVQSIVTANGGEVLVYTPWGKRKLAYPIRKRTRGLYVLMEYSGGPDMVAELERNLRIDERILKFITVKLEDRFDPEKEAERRASLAVPAFVEDDEEGVKAGGVADEEDEEGMPEDFDEEGMKEEDED
jgi:small subunit ribosomal protein S6